MVTRALEQLEAENREIDRLVGHNIRARRKALGITQNQVADGLGVTFQQVQKYERGANRVAASTLWRVAAFLRCDLRDLFVGAPAIGPSRAAAPATTEAAVVKLLAENGGLEMAEAFTAVPPRSRRPLIAIAHALGANGRGVSGAG